MYRDKTREELEELLYIYEDILDHIEEGIIVSDRENRIIFANNASEAIEGTNKKATLNKKMEEIYTPTRNNPAGTIHSAILQTGMASSSYLVEYMVKETKNVLRVIERMYPVNRDKKTIAVYSVLKNLPLLKQSLEDTLRLQEHIHKEDHKNGTQYTFKNLIGQNIGYIETIAMAAKIAQSSNTVLIYGETGTGKELFAQSIHNASAYLDGPFISFNCAAIPENLMESIFFGTVKGAFTGAMNKPGLFEQAQDGTLFLDEINSMNLGLQAKILKVLEQKKVRRLGSDNESSINCRIICALNEDPIDCINRDKLRRDLYYRLSSSILCLPPLRERLDDIEVLCRFFILRYNETYGQSVKKVDDELMDVFMHYSWPGNIRELDHMIEAAFVASERPGSTIGLKNIPYYYKKLLLDHRTPGDGEGDARRPASMTPAADLTETGESMEQLVDSFERTLIKKALDACGGNVSLAAQKLQTKRQTLQYKMKKYEL